MDVIVQLWSRNSIHATLAAFSRWRLLIKASTTSPVSHCMLDGFCKMASRGGGFTAT
jgi:hypothetical protein